MAENFGLDLFGEPVRKPARSMKDYFMVPPFSVLDTTDKLWRARYRRWTAITGSLTETKEGVLGDADGLMGMINGASSNFDPVLAEIIMKWFNVPGGRILDPFGGEQTKGVVAGELGYPYCAVEFREDQVLLNRAKTHHYGNVKYWHGDSNNIRRIIGEHNFDFCFTSPPYYDLEVYSKEDMSALGTYEQFMQQYQNIFRQCYDMLADNRFLVVKVGEVRNKKTGEYYNFVGDNITCMKAVGFKYYNEIMLLNAVGTLAIRSRRPMNVGRKVGKRHQNVLVFYKGDLSKIKETFPEIMPDNDFYEDGATKEFRI